MESLVKVLSEFGVRPSGTAGRLFSNPNSPAKAPGSAVPMDTSPDVPAAGGAGVLPSVAPLPAPATAPAKSEPGAGRPVGDSVGAAVVQHRAPQEVRPQPPTVPASADRQPLGHQVPPMDNDAVNNLLVR